MASIYVASSWRNQYYPEVVKRLREEGHQVYDFRDPPHGGTGFHWTDVDENAHNWAFCRGRARGTTCSAQIGTGRGGQMGTARSAQ